MSTIRIAGRGAARQGPRVRMWLLLIGGALALLAAAALVLMGGHTSAVPADLNLATTRSSEQGLYLVGYAPQRSPIAINQLHSWVIHVTGPDGQPVSDATIVVDGGMPQHGHGLPTSPQVTQNLGNGDYLVEGMKFQMSGWWVVDFTIDSGGQRDSVRFNLILQ
jgi:hypothetical protein